MSRELIAIDIDDVLANSTDSLRHFVNMERGVDLTEKHYRIEAAYWGYYESVLEQHDIDAGSLIDDWHNGIAEGSSDIRPIKGAIEGVNALSKCYRLRPITSRPAVMRSETERWLQRYFSGLLSDAVYLGFLPDAAQTKGEACDQIGADYLIDDNIDHCKSAMARDVNAILFGNYGWHQEIPASLPNCRTWPEVTRFLSV